MKVNDEYYEGLKRKATSEIQNANVSTATLAKKSTLRKSQVPKSAQKSVRILETVEEHIYEKQKTNESS